MKSEYGTPVSDESKLRFRLRSIHPDEFMATLSKMECCLRNCHRKTCYYGTRDLVT